MKRPARTDAWLDDACLCGHPRRDHADAAGRPVWPASVTRRGRCRGCTCEAFSIDVDALIAAENARGAARLAVWRDDSLSRWP
jgi:hypothetical protein